MPELVAVLADTGVYVRLNTGAGSRVSFQATATKAFTGGNTGSLPIGGNNQFPSSSIQHLDVNGDGREDLVWSGNVNVTCHFVSGGIVCTPQAQFKVLISDGLLMHAGYTIAGAVNPWQFIPLNFNNDACTDFVDPTSGNIYVAGCNGNTAMTVSAPPNIVAAVDWDGDGLTDLVTNVSGKLQVSRSNGTTVTGAAVTGITAPNGQIIVTDQNGDGLDDLAYANPGSSNALFFGVRAGSNVAPDLATAISDGYHIAFNPSYVALSDSSAGTITGGRTPEPLKQCFVRDLERY